MSEVHEAPVTLSVSPEAQKRIDRRANALHKLDKGLPLQAHELAAVWDVAPITIRRAVRDGSLPAPDLVAGRRYPAWSSKLINRIRSGFHHDRWVLG